MDTLTAQHQSENRKDYFTEKDGVTFAGTHLIVDFWDAQNLSDLQIMEQAMTDAVKVAGATLLHIHLHHFNENGGITGVAVLSESHITVHSWPELGYCAMDVFMCGLAQPEKAIEIFQSAFSTTNVQVTRHQRGVIQNT